MFPGCGATSAFWTDAHHLHHWADGGPTSLDNLVLLCRGHHRLLHADPDDPHGRPWTLDPATRQFVRPDGVVHEPPEPGEHTHRPDRHRSNPDPTALHGDGERLTGWAIDLYLDAVTPPPDPEPD